jgi:hypothetical protein
MSQQPIAKSDAARQKEREEEFLQRYNFWYHYNNPQLPDDQDVTLEAARVSRNNHLKTYQHLNSQYLGPKEQKLTYNRLSTVTALT